MPFFPALAKKFPAVHQLLSSLNSLRSRLLRPRTTDTTSIISSVHQQHLKRNDYIELGEIPRLDDAGATTAPETYRMGLEGFSSGDR